MSELTPQLVDDVVAACQSGAEEAAGALGRALDAEFTLAVGEGGAYDAATPPPGFDGPGLAVLFSIGGAGAAALIPESTNLLPDWYANPDPTGASKLSTLAQELSMLLLPESLLADEFAAQRVERLGDALARAGVADDAALVPLTATSGDRSGDIMLVWPLSQPSQLLPTADDADPAPQQRPSNAAPTAASSAGDNPKVDGNVRHHWQSWLRVQVPLSVTLATKKETVQEIVELAPGTIIKFDRACDELLELCAGGQPIAEGEAVKIGEKFGFRVSAMVLPQERFVSDEPPPRQAG